MADIKELISRIDLHDLAERLGLTRPMARGNYKSPHHKDKNPSVSIFDTPDGPRWKDHSGSDKDRGSCVDLVMYVEGCDVGEAVKRLHEMYGIARDELPKAKRERSKIEWLADQCKPHAAKAREYLAGRGIADAVIDLAIKCGALGFNDWTSPKVAEGQPGHGGPAPAFIVRTTNPGSVVAVDFRYLDPDLNGGVKTQTQGEKAGHVWYSDLRALKRAHTVVVVESPINAMSVESVGRKGVASVATRGVNVGAIDWHFLMGKRVLICLDADAPDQHGKAPGVEASWTLLELLTGLNITAHLVDQAQWYEDELNDINDVLVAKGKTDVWSRLCKLQPWAIPGVMGKGEAAVRPRVYLPPHDLAQYWKFRCKEDFTTFVAKLSNDGEDDAPQEIFADLCGFRVAAITRVTVASAVSAMTGEDDLDPRTLFSVSVQLPRHKGALKRKVFEDERLHNLDQWRKFGPVFNQGQFSRMVSILERGAELGARDAVNFVGLAWRDGKPIVNEGPDCYFTDPAKQCPYANLTFPTGEVGNARQVIEAYQGTFKHNAAAQLLVWALGGHLKAYLGFWPHMTLQADKGTGKSVLAGRLSRTIGMTVFSGQSLQTEFRLLTSVSHTAHPVGWEELSARSQQVISKAESILQESYQYTLTRRGSDMTEYLLCAPVLLAGEDVPVKSLTGKLVRSELTQRGPMLDEHLPTFPVRPWLEYLARRSRDEVREMHNNALTWALDHSRAPADDKGAQRMAHNYAALMVAWRLLCDFADVPIHQGGFLEDTVAEMNRHISETDADREPWVWILDTVLSEMEAGRFHHPYSFGDVSGGPGEGTHLCLMIRTSHVMDHIAHTPALREKWNALPVKSDRVFKKQLINSGIVVDADVERVINGRRCAHMVAIGLDRMGQYGLYASVSEKMGV